MIENELIIIIFFRLLNFAVLLGLAFYLCGVYLFPTLKEQLAKCKEYLAGLRRAHLSLKKDERMLKKEIVTDREWQSELKEKLLQWRSVVHDQRKQLKQDRDARKQILQQRMEEHKHRVGLYRLYKVVTPEAIIDARKLLEKKFASDDLQKRFVQTVIADMRKQ